MPDYRFIKATSLAQIWNDHGENLWGFLFANPGATQGDCATALGISPIDARHMLQIMEAGSALIRSYDPDGNESLWPTPVLASLVVPLLSTARDWINLHDGASVQQLADALAVPYAVAYRCAQLVALERDIRLEPLE